MKKPEYLAKKRRPRRASSSLLRNSVFIVARGADGRNQFMVGGRRSSPTMAIMPSWSVISILRASTFMAPIERGRSCVDINFLSLSAEVIPFTSREVTQLALVGTIFPVIFTSCAWWLCHLHPEDSVSGTAEPFGNSSNAISKKSIAIYSRTIKDPSRAFCFSGIKKKDPRENGVFIGIFSRLSIVPVLPHFSQSTELDYSDVAFCFSGDDGDFCVG